MKESDERPGQGSQSRPDVPGSGSVGLFRIETLLELAARGLEESEDRAHTCALIHGAAEMVVVDNRYQVEPLCGTSGAQQDSHSPGYMDQEGFGNSCLAAGSPSRLTPLTLESEAAM